MADYMLNSRKMTISGNDMVSFSKKLQECTDTITTMRSLVVLSNAMFSWKQPRNEIQVLLETSLKQLIEELSSESNSMNQMGETLVSIVNMYLSKEQEITNHYRGDYEMSSPVFDGSGGYGGNQGDPESNVTLKKELYDVVRNYYPDLTDAEVAKYLTKLNSEGCGYVAIINTIFATFAGREAEFEETFGFPMYGTDGDLNFELLLVDFYSATDNHSSSIFGNDKISGYEDYDYDDDGWPFGYCMEGDTTGKGTTPSEQKYRGEMYLKDHGIDVTISNNQDVTVDNYQSLIEEGKYVTINYHYGNLYKEDGSVAQYINGGHAMVVTGVTDDGLLIVSSWGKKYYIDPNEVMEKDKNKTWMDFNVIRYE